MDFPPFWFSEKWPFGKKCHVCSPFADWGFVPSLKSFTNTRPPWKPLYWKMRGALIWELLEIEKKKNREKVQWTRGLSSGYQSNFFRSYHKISNKSLSDFIFIFLTKQQLQNLNQISLFQLNLNFKILTKRRFGISTKNNLHNLNQRSAAKLLTKLQLQNRAWTSTSKSWPNLVLKVWTKKLFMTKIQLPHLHWTIVNTFHSINISNCNNHNKLRAGIFTRQGHINQVY